MVGSLWQVARGCGEKGGKMAIFEKEDFFYGQILCVYDRLFFGVGSL